MLTHVSIINVECVVTVL